MSMEPSEESSVSPTIKLKMSPVSMADQKTSPSKCVAADSTPRPRSCSTKPSCTASSCSFSSVSCFFLFAVAVT
ncbi:unnamed protein product, partial [Amoebophrya sp. A120]|eukprot:GSA120T00018163001.1